jgi:hypothetical protein
MNEGWALFVSPICRSSALLLVYALLATGCDQEMTGVFQSDRSRYEFFPDGRAAVIENGATVAARYEVQGDRVLVTTDGGMRVLRRDGSGLVAPDGVPLRDAR